MASHVIEGQLWTVSSMYCVTMPLIKCCHICLDLADAHECTAAGSPPRHAFYVLTWLCEAQGSIDSGSAAQSPQTPQPENGTAASAATCSAGSFVACNVDASPQPDITEYQVCPQRQVCLFVLVAMNL